MQSALENQNNLEALDEGLGHANLFALNIRQLEQALLEKPDLLWDLTPDALRRLCDNRSSAARVIGDSFEALVHLQRSDGMSKKRAGFVQELSDLEWLAKMREIAQKCERFEPMQFDEDEEGFDEEAERLRVIQERQDSRQRAAALRLEALGEQSLKQGPVSDEKPEHVALDEREARKVDQSTQWRQLRTGPAAQDSESLMQVQSAAAPRAVPRRPVRLTPVHTGSLVISNLLTRCALGTIGQRGLAANERPRYTPDEPLCLTRVSGFKPSELVVSYSGQELAVGELETWSALLKLASPANLGGRVQFWSRDVLELLQRGTGGPAYRRLREEIQRLQGGVVTMRTTLQSVKRLFKEMFPHDPVVNDRRFANSEHPIEVSFSLLGPASTDGSRWSIVVPREVALAFSEQMTTWFNREGYLSMKSDVARRLFLFYVSHPQPWPFSAFELGEFVGSRMSRPTDLRRQMTKAHEEMQLAGFIESWSYGPSQRRPMKEPVFDVRFARRKSSPAEVCSA